MDFMLEEEMIDLLTFCLQNPDSDEIESKKSRFIQVGKEIFDEHNDLDVIFVPVGGGGLLAGISAWAAQTQTKTKIYGVEVEDSACLVEAIKADKRVRLREVGLFADGVAVERIGKHNFDVIKECVDGVITVSIDELCAAAELVMGKTKKSPMAIIKNYQFDSKDDQISNLIRPGSDDLFK